MENFGIQLMPIPARYIWLLQPVSVDISKPFKDQVKAKFNDWLIKLAEADVSVGNPSRNEIQEWVCESWEAIHIIQNAWLESRLSYFSSEE